MTPHPEFRTVNGSTYANPQTEIDRLRARVAELETELSRLRRKPRLRIVDTSNAAPRTIGLADWLHASGLSGFKMIPKLRATLERKMREDPAAFAIAIAEARMWNERTRERNRISYKSDTSYF